MLALHRASKGRTASVYLVYNWTVASGLGICLGDTCSTGEHRCREPKPPCSMSSMGQGVNHPVPQSVALCNVCHKRHKCHKVWHYAMCATSATNATKCGIEGIHLSSIK